MKWYWVILIILISAALGFALALYLIHRKSINENLANFGSSVASVAKDASSGAARMGRDAGQVLRQDFSQTPRALPAQPTFQQ